MNEKMVKIEIITGGRSENTCIKINGEEWKIEEFKFSVSIPHRQHGRLVGGHAVLQAQRDIDGLIVPVLAVKDSFEKLAEASERNKEKKDE